MTTTLKLRRMLLAGHAGVSLEMLDRHVVLQNVTEDEEGFDADWHCTPVGEAILRRAVMAGVTRRTT
jgi:hypothetical protein